MKTELTHQRLLEMLSYDPGTGVFRWRTRAAVCLAPGDVAGTVHAKNGYRQIKVGYVAVLAHRLAWFYVYGAWPTVQIDHVNGVRDDNRIANLRLASPSVNGLNRHRLDSSSTGFTGVYRKRGRFGARLIVDGRQRYFGVFDTPEMAHEAYLRAREDAIRTKLTVLEELQAGRAA